MENKNMKLIKQILVTLMLFLPINFAFAESYIMFAPNDITSVNCSNNNVVQLHIISNLMNEKRTVIVTSLSDGNTNFSIKLKNKKCDYKAVVKNGKLNITGDKTIKVLSVDLPPELTLTEETK